MRCSFRKNTYCNLYFKQQTCELHYATTKARVIIYILIFCSCVYNNISLRISRDSSRSSMSTKSSQIYSSNVKVRRDVLHCHSDSSNPCTRGVCQSNKVATRLGIMQLQHGETHSTTAGGTQKAERGPLK